MCHEGCFSDCTIVWCPAETEAVLILTLYICMAFIEGLTMTWTWSSFQHDIVNFDLPGDLVWAMNTQAGSFPSPSKDMYIHSPSNLSLRRYACFFQPCKSMLTMCINLSTQPCNLHRQTLTVEWQYRRAQWLSNCQRHRIPSFQQVSSSTLCPVRAAPVNCKCCYCEVETSRSNNNSNVNW